MFEVTITFHWDLLQDVEKKKRQVCRYSAMLLSIKKKNNMNEYKGGVCVHQAKHVEGMLLYVVMWPSMAPESMVTQNIMTSRQNATSRRGPSPPCKNNNPHCSML
jgi:hypothetical protein